MKALLMFLSLSLSLSTFAANGAGIQCGNQSTRLEAEFCQVSYKTLAVIQGMQINGKISSALDIEKMEAVLHSGQVQATELQADLWKDASLEAKANRSFKILLSKSGQTALYQQLGVAAQNSDIKVQSMTARLENTTGTRGGGFGNETYIMPQGFWID